MSNRVLQSIAIHLILMQTVLTDRSKTRPAKYTLDGRAMCSDSLPNPASNFQALGDVPLSVDLGDIRRAVAQDYLRGLQTELPSDLGGCCVSELIGRPAVL